MHPSVGSSTEESASLQPAISLCNDGQEVVLQGLDRRELRFHAVWLRYNCQCSDCVQPHSGQRLLESCHINPDTNIETASINEYGTELHLKWADSQHEGHVKLDFLKKHSYHGHKEPVSRDQANRLPSISYEEVISGDKGLLRWLQHINQDGMCLVKGAPTEMTTLMELVERVAPVQTTIYGKLFGVESTPNPINVAYTSVKLDYHMDLVYYESPPGLQFLHCIRFDDCVIGGENYMLNVSAVAERFRRQHPADFDILTKVPATFQKIHFARSEPVKMKYQRPHINLNHRGEIVNVIWSPQFEGPLNVDYSDVQPYYRAYHKFSQAIKNDKNFIELRLVPGEILSFNNRTILHARKSFELNGGVRKLQGCYLNIDEYKSKLAVLAHLHGDDEEVKHVGNQCWF
ncbi:LOW QUALITY PROTEIN: gamma-butyrobetaine dioxygenase-like [Pecten maximus]|uniref:LOW QUALITY PROTEIN: gamma-butyrobetaine dioxygenase-like n=1 Tax=Pecten maximus TaxID=6579 RepID=UPI001458AC2B|nr:LOW QUALITY PROTEIN: gamma-butyrobetaine dioxygenase-like [Pecten maximus]